MATSEVEDLRQETVRLRHKLLDAEETIRAIRDGRVDAFVVGKEQRERVYMLESIDGPFRILVERMQQGASTVAEDGTIHYANQGFSELLDRGPERIVGHRFRDYVAEPDRPLFDALIAGEIDRSQGEIRLERPDGTLVPVYLNAGALSPDNGREVCLLITDLTQQKQHEELIAAETLSRSMLEQAADAVVVCDPGGTIVLASPDALELCGRNPLRQSFAHILPLKMDEPSPLAPDGYFELGRLQSPIRGAEVSLQGADGNLKPLLLSAGPVRDSQGAPLGSVVTLTDIGVLKRAEEELKDADQRKDEFLAVLAHELRNPLAPVVSGLEVLRLAGVASGPSAAVFEMMERQVSHLIRLVDDLLEVSRIARGKIELRKEIVDFADALADALQTSRPAIDAAEHSFEADLPAEPIRVEADSVRLTQVITNLLNNAARYSPPASRIRLTARAENGQLIVRVRDSGYGIAADSLDGIFEMFAQTHRSSRAESGLGVGLALVRTLVEMHGGSISAASEGRGCGSEFTMHLPLGNVTQRETLDPEMRTGRNSTLKKILVVDDNRDSATSLGMLLSAMDYDTRVVFDGPSALDELDDFPAEAIFLDIDMPGMDGYEVARRIRQRNDNGGVLLVAVTGWGQENDRAMSRGAGFDHHLLKPVDMASIRAILTAA